MEENKIPFPYFKERIDQKGSLGILAYGDIGLREWRKVKIEVNRGKK